MKKIIISSLFLCGLLFFISSCKKETVHSVQFSGEIQNRTNYTWEDLEVEFELNPLEMTDVKEMVLPVIDEMEPSEITDDVLDLQNALVNDTYSNVTDYIVFQNSLTIPLKLTLLFFDSASEAKDFIQGVDDAYSNMELVFDVQEEMLPEADCDQWEPRTATNTSTISIQHPIVPFPNLFVHTSVPGFLDIVEFDTAFKKGRTSNVFSNPVGTTLPFVFKWISGNSWAEPFPITEDCPTNIEIEVSGCFSLAIIGISTSYIWHGCYVEGAVTDVNDFNF